MEVIRTRTRPCWATVLVLMMVIIAPSSVPVAQAERNAKSNSVSQILGAVVTSDPHIWSIGDGVRFTNVILGGDGMSSWDERTADAGILFGHRSPPPACIANHCASGPNVTDYCHVRTGSLYTCATVSAGQSCTSARMPRPCYDVVRASFEQRTALAQIGGSTAVDGEASINSFIAPASPNATGTTLHVRLSNLPVGPFRLALYWASWPDHRNHVGCEIVATPTGSAHDMASDGIWPYATSRQQGFGEISEYAVGHTSTVDIYESVRRGCSSGNFRGPRDGQVPLGGVFLLPAAVRTSRVPRILLLPRQTASGNVGGIVFTDADARIDVHLMVPVRGRAPYTVIRGGRSDRSGIFRFSLPVNPIAGEPVRAALTITAAYRNGNGSGVRTIRFNL
jgi:hypothetical protein